jgi:hypothetical protein
MVTLSVDSSADIATSLAGYVPVLAQTSIAKVPMTIIETRPMNVNRMILFAFILAPW